MAKNAKSAARRLRLFVFCFYIYFIKLEGIKWTERTVCFSLQMCSLEEMWRVWGLDKNFPELLASALGIVVRNS
jgi:hypothetical protein